MKRKLSIRRIADYFHSRRSVREYIQGATSFLPVSPVRTIGKSYPGTTASLTKSELYNRWWYYSVELLPGMMTKGIYPIQLPMLPRLTLRRCGVAGMDCLDLGSMEGLIPVIMKKMGARSVLGTDALDHCWDKIQAVQHYYQVDFEFCLVGLMYDLHRKLPERSFDLIDCSGLLYHVFSPLHVLAGVRPLLKRNGLLIISTNVINTDAYTMQFNSEGKLQTELNTFWYISVPLLEYLLRYLKLVPVDASYLSNLYRQDIAQAFRDVPTGYLSVVCRAVEDPRPTAGDAWMAPSVKNSWESLGLCDWQRCREQPRSSIQLVHPKHQEFWNPATDGLDLRRAVREGTHQTAVEQPEDSHVLHLTDRS